MHKFLQALHSKVSLLPTTHLAVETAEMNMPTNKIIDLDFPKPTAIESIDTLNLKITDIVSAPHVDWIIRETVKGIEIIFRGHVFAPSPVYSVGCGDVLMSFCPLAPDVVKDVVFYNGDRIFSETGTISLIWEQLDRFVQASVDGAFPKKSSEVFKFFLS